MPRTSREIGELLTRAADPGFRGQILTRGLARSLIWRSGELPAGSPAFEDDLSSKLFDLGYTLLSFALRIRAEDAFTLQVLSGFRSAGARLSTLWLARRHLQWRTRRGGPGHRLALIGFQGAIAC